jgi:rhomboid protease GluP
MISRLSCYPVKKHVTEFMNQSTKVLSYRHKFCSCGLLVDKNARICPGCGRKLHSRALYRVGRLLGFVTPEIGVAWPLLLLVITVVFVGEFWLGGLTSLLSPPVGALVRFGAIYTPAIQAGEYWRILSAGLVHIGLLHIIFNLMALSQLAPALEDEIGAWEFIALVTVSQIGCGCASYCLRPMVLSAGASGIAFGLIGFGLAYSHRQGGGRGLAVRDLYLK